MGLLKIGGGSLALSPFVSRAALSVDGVRNLVGLTADDIAKGENFNLNDPSSYRDQIGDYVRSFFTGVSTEKVKEKARDQAIKKVNDKYRASADDIKTRYETLGLSAPDEKQFQYGQGKKEATETADAVGQRVRQSELRLLALEDAAAAGVDISGLGNLSAPAIKNVQREFQRDQEELSRLKIRNENKADLLEQQMRQDKINEANRQREFQITQMQNALDNRRLDIQESRDYRKDRQLAIMQIMQGFANMGKAFAA